VSKDIKNIAEIEKAIGEKYGKEAIENPKKFWTKEKEKKYIDQSKKFYEKVEKGKTKSDVCEHKGMLVSKNILKKPSTQGCLVCKNYFLNSKDSVYVNRYQCCFECYVQHVEDREDRWATGWRPQID